MGSTTSSGSATVEPENDDTRRRAKVYILKTTVGTDAVMTLVNHWAIVFELFDTDEEPWVIIEGTCVDGKLQANYRSQDYKPSGTLIDPDSESGILSFVWRAVTLNLKHFFTFIRLPRYVHMSKSGIRQFALDNPCNGETYEVPHMDCQMWVTMAAGRLK